MGRRKELPQEYYIEWAKYLAENKIYFIFFYLIQFAPDGKDTHLTAETVEKIREVAGEYFLGDMIGETGSSFACKFPGYFNRKEGTGADPTVIKTDYADMRAAHGSPWNRISGIRRHHASPCHHPSIYPS